MGCSSNSNLLNEKTEKKNELLNKPLKYNFTFPLEKKKMHHKKK